MYVCLCVHAHLSTHICRHVRTNVNVRTYVHIYVTKVMLESDYSSHLDLR